MAFFAIIQEWIKTVSRGGSVNGMEPDYDVEQNEIDQLVAEVRAGLTLLVVAFKNYALYPESNSIRRASLVKVYEWLVNFIEAHGNFFLLVAKDSFLYQGQVVLQDKPNEQALIFPLFRDGVQWLEFAEGVTVEELETFVALLGRFRVLKEEAEDDLVTAMWEAGFTNITYKTADEFWETDPLIDLNSLKVAREQSNETGWGSGGYGGGTGGGGVGTGSGGIGGGLGGGIGAGAGGGAGLGPERAGPGSSDAVQGQPSAGTGPARSDSQGGDGSGSSKAIALSMQAMAGDINTDYLTNKAGSSQAKPISALFSFVDGAEDDQPESGGLNFSSPGEGAVFFKPEDVAQTQEAIKLAAGLASGRSELFKFTPQEAEQLRAMIAIEESRNTSKDGLEIILIVLKELEGRIDGAPILDFIIHEVGLVLAQGKIFQVRTFIEKMKAVAGSGGPWLAALLHEFNERIAAAEVLGVLKPIWQATRLPEHAWAELRRFLLLLPPDAVNVLVPVLAMRLDSRMETLLLEAVAIDISLLRTNPTALISKMKTTSILGLLHVFQQLKLPFPDSLLSGLTRHESPAVRETAAKLLIAESQDNIRFIFHLIEDPHIGLQSWFCSLLSKRRGGLGEKLLFDYLESAYTVGKELDKDRLLNCYRTLGRCGSHNVVPFLEEILFKKAWKSFFGIEGSAHRQGAAMALMLMPPDWGAGDLLKKASQSPFRAVKQAYRLAEAELNTPW